MGRNTAHSVLVMRLEQFDVYFRWTENSYKVTFGAEHGRRWDRYQHKGLDIIQVYYDLDFNSNHLRDICVIEVNKTW